MEAFQALGVCGRETLGLAFLEHLDAQKHNTLQERENPKMCSRAPFLMSGVCSWIKAYISLLTLAAAVSSAHSEASG